MCYCKACKNLAIRGIFLFTLHLCPNTMSNQFNIPLRLRRLRKKPSIQSLVRETELTVNDLVYPLFMNEGLREKKEASSLPGVYQLGVDDLQAEIEEVTSLNIPAVILFGIPNDKDDIGSHALSDNNIVATAIKKIKAIAPSLCIIADLCFCEYTSHGHCGVIESNSVDNDKTLNNLCLQALTLARAGVDIIAPSGMMDGTIAALRETLDNNGFTDISLLGYSAKYSSSFYGPFREAAGFTLEFGDRSEYQMDYANANEAIREVALDVDESADMVMVKPAGQYLDIIYRIKQHFPEVPLCAYQVSGEYALIKHGAKAGLIDEEKAMLESLIAIKRAGCDFIITYFAKQVAQYLQSN